MLLNDFTRQTRSTAPSIRLTSPIARLPKGSVAYPGVSGPRLSGRMCLGTTSPRPLANLRTAGRYPQHQLWTCTLSYGALLTCCLTQMHPETAVLASDMASWPRRLTSLRFFFGCRVQVYVETKLLTLPSLRFNVPSSSPTALSKLSWMIFWDRMALTLPSRFCLLLLPAVPVRVPR